MAVAAKATGTTRLCATEVAAFVEALHEATSRGHVEVARVCSADRRAPQGRFHSIALRFAARRGYTEAVRVLLADRRTDPSSESCSSALRSAVRNGHVDLVALLLADGRPSPAAGDGYVLSVAAVKGDVGVLSALLADGRADDAAVSAASHPGLLWMMSKAPTRCLVRHVRWLRRRRWVRTGRGVV
jgi:hypothetical protein